MTPTAVFDNLPVVKQTTVYLTSSLVRRIKSLTAKTGISQSEIIRRGIEMFLEKMGIPKK